MEEPEITDEAFLALADERRRELLVALLETDGRDRWVDPYDVLGADREAGEDALCLPLYHVHLPRLADEGYVQWDRHRGRVRPGPNFEEVARILEAIRRHGESDDGQSRSVSR